MLLETTTNEAPTKQEAAAPESLLVVPFERGKLKEVGGKEKNEESVCVPLGMRQRQTAGRARSLLIICLRSVRPISGKRKGEFSA